MRILIVAAAAAALLGSASAGDVDAGKKVFAKCAMCHKVGDGAKNAVGPQLNGVLSRPMGSAEGFNYSPNLKEYAASNPVWTEETLSAYLENPKAVLPKGKMAFIGLKKVEDRDNVIAYLKTFP